MDLSTFIITVFCLIDDRLKDLGRLRERGPAPTLCDSEVLTIEVVGEFLGLDEDTELFAYFRRHYAHYFPNLRQVHRTTFTLDRQRTCGRGKGTPLARASHLRSSRPYLRHLRLDALTGAPVRPSPSLLSLQRGGSFRQGHPPQADPLRLQGARKSLLAWGDQPHLGSSCQRPRALCSPRACRVHLGPSHRRSQLPLAQDQGGVIVCGC